MVNHSISSGKLATALSCLVRGLYFSPPLQKLQVFGASFHDVCVALCAHMGSSPVDFSPVVNLKHIFTHGGRSYKFVIPVVMPSPVFNALI